MTSRLLYRGLAVGCLFVLLGGLLVWAGTVDASSATHNYPDATDISMDGDVYLDERVSIVGTVVETTPLTIQRAVPRGKTVTFVVENAALSPSVGDELWVHGTLRADNHVEAHNTVHRQQWERQYMYVVSFLAGLLVLGRLLNDWTVDTTEWAVVPRTEPLFRL